MDDESIIEIVDFSEFEMLFQVKKSKKAEKFKQREESECIASDNKDNSISHPLNR